MIYLASKIGHNWDINSYPADNKTDGIHYLFPASWASVYY